MKRKVIGIGVTELTDNPLRFDHWLKSHKNEETAIGDLARDYIQSSHEHMLLNDEYLSVEDSMVIHDACQDAYEAYDQAMELYKLYVGTFNDTKATDSI